MCVSSLINNLKIKISVKRTSLLHLGVITDEKYLQDRTLDHDGAWLRFKASHTLTNCWGACTTKPF
jgi:hypothetical protein